MARSASTPQGPVVPLAQARAFVLAKQGLAGTAGLSAYDAVVATAGVYSTAPTCYLSCAARVDGFQLAHLDDELYRNKRLVRLRCMRQSAYIQPVEALPAVIGATGERVGQAVGRLVRATGVTDEAYAALADCIEAALANRSPATVPEIRDLLGSHVPPHREALQFAVALMCRHMRLVRAEVRGSWSSDNYTYARWAEWIGAPLQEMEPAQARAELTRRYLCAFGPATAADLTWWAGWAARDTTAAIAALGDEIATVTLADEAETRSDLLLANELPALLDTNPESARGVRLLPVWDAYLMGYAMGPTARSRLVATSDYPRVYARAGNATSVALIDGVAAGVWEFDFAANKRILTVRVAPFGQEAIGQEAIARWVEIEEAATRIATAIEANQLQVERAPEPGQLADGARNAFLAPIRLGRPA